MYIDLNIDLTVALPVYNSSKILWLCLEGLCRQRTTYVWELIVMEDPSDDYAGEDYLKPYIDRLKEAGCINVRYINLDKWIPLGDKWINIAKIARGENFMLTAADNFSPPERIEISCESLKKYSWFDGRCSLFYNVLTNDLAKFTADEKKTGVWMCTKTKLVRLLKGPGPPSGIDGWMRRTMRLKVADRYTTRDQLLNGLHTDGLNNISLHRKKNYGGVGFTKNKIKGVNPEPGTGRDYYIAVFERTDTTLEHILPNDVFEKLCDLHNNLKTLKHTVDNKNKKVISKDRKSSMVVSKDIKSEMIVSKDMENIPPPEPGPIKHVSDKSPDLRNIFPQQL